MATSAMVIIVNSYQVKQKVIKDGILPLNHKYVDLAFLSEVVDIYI